MPKRESPGTVGKIELNGDDYLAGLRAVVSQLWGKMMEEQGADPNDKFVIIDPANKYFVFYNNAVRQYQEALAARTVLGYVGLQIVAGQATIPARQRTRRAK